MKTIKYLNIIPVVVFNLALLFLLSSCLSQRILKDADNNNAAKELNTDLFVNARAGLMLRENHDLASKKIALIPLGSKVHCIRGLLQVEKINGQSGSWTYVEWNGKHGWVFGGYLAEENLLLLNPALDDLRKKAQNYYSSRKETSLYNKANPSKSDKAVKIKQILGQYAAVEYWIVQNNSIDPETNGALWIYINDNWEEYQTDFQAGYDAKLLYLNNDDLPDCIVSSGCCNNTNLVVMLGKQHGGFRNVYYTPENTSDYDLVVKRRGKCGETVIEYYHEETGKRYTYHFDCKKETMFPVDGKSFIPDEQ